MITNLDFVLWETTLMNNAKHFFVLTHIIRACYSHVE